MNVNASISEGSGSASSLQEFLSISRDELAGRMDPKMLMASARDGEHKFAGWMAESHWTHLPDRMASQMCDALQENVAGIFVGAWSKYRELQTCAEETRDDPGRTCELVLGEHDFTYELTPSVHVLLNNVKVAEIPFAVAVTFTVNAVELVLQRGRVQEVRSGACRWSGEIRCAEHVVWTHECPEVDLPGHLRLAGKFPLLEEGVGQRKI